MFRTRFIAPYGHQKVLHLSTNFEVLVLHLIISICLVNCNVSVDRVGATSSYKLGHGMKTEPSPWQLSKLRRLTKTMGCG